MYAQLYSYVPIKKSNGVIAGRYGRQENGPLLPIHIILKKERILKFENIAKNIVLNKYWIFLLKLDTLSFGIVFTDSLLYKYLLSLKFI